MLSGLFSLAHASPKDFTGLGFADICLFTEMKHIFTDIEDFLADLSNSSDAWMYKWGCVAAFLFVLSILVFTVMILTFAK